MAHSPSASRFHSAAQHGYAAAGWSVSTSLSRLASHLDESQFGPAAQPLSKHNDCVSRQPLSFSTASNGWTDKRHVWSRTIMGLDLDGSLKDRSVVDSKADLFDSLETARLKLRCVDPGDAVAIAEMMTPAVSRWVASWPIPFTVQMAIERIASARQACAEGKALVCAIERRSDGVLLGWIAVTRQGSGERRAMLGYWIGESHHGRGYMREAAPTAVALAFRNLDLDVIEAAAQPENKATFAVLRRCGMTPAGERTIYAPARIRDELCLVYEVAKSGTQVLEKCPSNHLRR